MPGRRLFWTGAAICLGMAFSIGLVATRSRKSATPQPSRVAILPFDNTSGDPSLDYLRSALPDEIAHSLASARSLTMRPLAASARFSDRGVDFRKTGRDL